MQDPNINTVRAVSIATIIFASLGILLYLLFLLIFAAIGSFTSDASIFESYVIYRDDYGFSNGLDGYYSLDAGETASAVSGVFTILTVFAVIGIALSAVGLVAGIFGVRDCRNPQKAGHIMGWSIAGAICTGLSVNLIACVLLIVNAVYAGRLRQAAQNLGASQQAWGYAASQGYGTPQTYAAPQGYAPVSSPQQGYGQQPIMPTQSAAAPAVQQPVQPFAPTQQQPAAPVQPAQPVAPAQPVSPVQPVSPTSEQPANPAQPTPSQDKPAGSA